jgi:3-phosphoshikimate 1-carboxyvinyltransferase
MGGKIEFLNRRSAGEPAADLLVSSSSLHGCTIEGSMIPALIDEIPVLAVMAACAEGTTVIKDAAELKVKESDRIATVTENLRAMGADIEPTPDGMIIKGGKPLHGAAVRTYGDHRLAMSFAIAAMIADGETSLDDEACAKVSYPGFFDALKSLSD